MSSPASQTNSVTTIFNAILSSAETAVIAVVMGTLAIFAPKLAMISLKGLEVIGANFKLFLHNVMTNSQPWSEALADMLTADWNEVSDDEKTLATDFAEAVATALEKTGLIKA